MKNYNSLNCENEKSARKLKKMKLSCKKRFFPFFKPKIKFK